LSGRVFSFRQIQRIVSQGSEMLAEASSAHVLAREDV